MTCRMLTVMVQHKQSRSAAMALTEWKDILEMIVGAKTPWLKRAALVHTTTATTMRIPAGIASDTWTSAQFSRRIANLLAAKLLRQMRSMSKADQVLTIFRGMKPPDTPDQRPSNNECRELAALFGFRADFDNPSDSWSNEESSHVDQTP